MPLRRGVQRVDGIALRHPSSQAFGPFRRTTCTIRTMVEAAIKEAPARIHYRPNTRCQFVYIDDVVAALMAALSVGKRFQRVYDISGGPRLSYVPKVSLAQGIAADSERLRAQ